MSNINARIETNLHVVQVAYDRHNGDHREAEFADRVRSDTQCLGQLAFRGEKAFDGRLETANNTSPSKSAKQ